MSVRTVPALRSRRGKILVLVATLLPVLMGLVALAVDTGVIGTARGQMQISTDSAALAGAMQLALNRTSTTTLIGRAQTSSLGMVASNGVLNQPLVVSSNPTNAPGGQIVVGYLS